MPGPAPKETRRRRNTPARGDWQPAKGEGWQHGEIPSPPDGLYDATRTAWDTWFRAWFASHWSPDDLPGLRQLIRLYDQVERGEFQRAAELRLQMDGYGVTPKGQQVLRWARPKPAEKPQDGQEAAPNPYGHLRAV